MTSLGFLSWAELAQGLFSQIELNELAQPSSKIEPAKSDSDILTKNFDFPFFRPSSSSQLELAQPGSR